MKMITALQHYNRFDHHEDRVTGTALDYQLPSLHGPYVSLMFARATLILLCIENFSLCIESYFLLCIELHFVVLHCDVVKY